MGSQWTIGKKLIASFLAVATVTAALGIIGYYGVNQGSIAINELGVVRLPSIESMLTISEGQTAVDTTENALLSRAIDLRTRQGKYDDFAAIWLRIEDAWKIYEPLPQTTEEAATWKEFVPAWNAWKSDHEEYVRLSKEYDKYVEAYFESNDDYKKKVFVELSRSKQILEKELNKEIHFICWPGGAYNQDVIALAKKVGYHAWTLSSSDRLS